MAPSKDIWRKIAVLAVMGGVLRRRLDDFFSDGNISPKANRVMWAKNSQSPQVLGKQYREKATEENARIIAHRFADEIIFRLGGGIQGIAESKIVFVSSRGGNKEIWLMDYDGANQRPLTHLGSIALSPRISPDGSRVAFSAMYASAW